MTIASLNEILDYPKLKYKRYILFDIDETLFDSDFVTDIYFKSISLITNQQNISRPELGIVPVSDSYLMQQLNIGKKESHKIIETYNRLFLSTSEYIFRNSLYADAQEVVKELFLNNMSIGIYTLRNVKLAIYQIMMSGLDSYVSRISHFPNKYQLAITGSGFKANMNNSNGFENKLEQIKFHLSSTKGNKIHENEVLVVGDSMETDIAVAQTLRIDYLHILRNKSNE
jgi:phosphoglycolate phosphatase-like HAD superfamily hydrolase